MQVSKCNILALLHPLHLISRRRTNSGPAVKALSKRNPVPLGSSIDRLMGDWYVEYRIDLAAVMELTDMQVKLDILHQNAHD